MTQPNEMTVEVIVDPEKKILSVYGEHTKLFYEVWNGMLKQAKSEEREECAVIAESFSYDDLGLDIPWECDEVAARIRARGDERLHEIL